MRACSVQVVKEELPELFDHIKFATKNFIATFLFHTLLTSHQSSVVKIFKCVPISGVLPLPLKGVVKPEPELFELNPVGRKKGKVC